MRVGRGNTVVLAVLFLAVAALLSSCATLRFQQGRSRAQAQLTESVLERYAYPETEFERLDLRQVQSAPLSGSGWETPFRYTIRAVSETGAYVLHEVEVFTGMSPVRFDYYMVKAPERGPVVLVFPIFGGKYVFAKTFADYFAKHGLHCALMYRKKGLTEAETFAEFEPPLKQIVVDSKIAIDWLCGRAEVDSARIGAFGISMGGIKSAAVKCLEPRIGPAVVALAGGTLADVLASSGEPEIVERREKIMRNEGIGIVAFHERADAAILTDPLKLARYADASEVKMFVTLFDRTVPTKLQFRLWRSLGRPQLSIMPFGHYTAVLALPYARWQSRRFFEKKFGMRSVRHPPQLPAHLSTAS